MNGIFGLIATQPSFDVSAPLAAMQQAMTAWGHDGLTAWQDGPVALGCAMLHTTPEDLHERLPLHAPHLGLTLTAGCRLDNRQALLADLRPLVDDWCRQTATALSPAVIPDSLLILFAYQKWGSDCVHHLLGDWLFALWDAPQRRLLIARDHLGVTGLYYLRGPGWLAFASSKKALLALPGPTLQPNLRWLAELLIAWRGDGLQTSYEGIYRLPPAHTMRISPQGGEPQISQYWHLEETPPLHLESDEAYAEGLLDVFTQAVQDRLRCHRPIAATLSGGLDSGSVVAVAGPLLRQQNRGLIACTSVPLGDVSFLPKGHFGDEWPFASETARHAGVAEHIALPAEGISPLAGMEWMLATRDEPVLNPGNLHWFKALFETAQQRQAGALLTGQMGNAVISWQGGEHSFLPHLIARDWRGFWQAVEREQRAYGISRSQVLRNAVFKPLLWPAWSSLRRATIQFKPPEWVQTSALRQDFGEQLGLPRVSSRSARPRFDPLAARLQFIRPGCNWIGSGWYENGSAYGMAVRDPSGDRRVITYAIAVPDEQFRADRQDRWLLRRAMQGLLPDSVRLNRRIGYQAADIAYRVVAHGDEIRAALARCRSHPLCSQMLDLARMETMLAAWEQSATPSNTLAGSGILLRGLCVGLFLLRW
jgi:asparagine synthase (glutamine-hydrolysing)